MCVRPVQPSAGESRAQESKLLKEKIEAGSTEEKVAGLAGVQALAEALKQASEPFAVPLVPAILVALAHKVRIQSWWLWRLRQLLAALGAAKLLAAPVIACNICYTTYPID